MDKPSPTFSIVVPVYKAEAYLRPCLDSIVGQSCSDFELILVDDGSPDRSGAICDRYAAADTRIRVIHKANGGHAAARNAGTKIACGTYILYVDSDDWLEKTALEELSAVTGSEPDVAVYSFCYHFEDGTVREASSLAPLPAECSNADFLRYVATRRAFELGLLCNKIYKRALLEENGVRLIENTIHDDGPFFLETFYHAKTIAIVPRPLYHYRRHSEATTATNTIRNYESLMLGIAHTEALLEGRRYDKYISLILLNYAVFATTMRYRTDEDTRMELQRSRTPEYRRLLLRLLRRSHFAPKTFVLAAMVLCSPKLTKKLLRTL